MRPTLLLPLLLAACTGGSGVPLEVVAEVNGQAITEAQLAAYLERHVGDAGGALDSSVLSSLLDQLLTEELLRRHAVARGVVAAAATRRQAVEALLAPLAEEPVPAHEVAEYYRWHRRQLALPERLRLRHILVADASTAERSRQEILGGRPFAEVAREVSLDPSAPRGGDQGELAVDDLPSPFAEPVAALAPGEVSEVVRASDGYHLFLVEERLAPAHPSLDEAAPRIEERLRGERADRRVEELIASAEARYNVAVHAENLPFEYQGRYAHDTRR